MKKYLSLLFVAFLMASISISCSKDDDDDDDNTVIEAAMIAEVTATWGWADDAQETWKYTYDTEKRLTKIDNYWEGVLDKSYTYDYSTAGKLFITRTGESPVEYDLDSEGRITKEYWSTTEWAQYVYNADGFMTQIIEHWGDADHLKYDIEVLNDNITQQTRYDDDGTTVNRIKTFTYTIGDNVNNINEAIVESSWKTVSGLYGETSKKLVDYLDYWNGPGDEANAKRTTLSYQFDDKNRVSILTRAGDGWTEVFEYTYVE
jgi:hypothetical protein